MRAGHTLELLLDGAAAWRAMAAAIAAARETIDIQLYMLEPDEVGRAFVHALCEALQRGVLVRIMLDGAGSASADPESLDLLVRAGAAIWVFGALRHSAPWSRWLRRNHRKVFVFDRSTAIVTGRNVGSHYLSLQAGDATWLDAGVLLRGPVVASLARLLSRDWHHHGRRRRPRSWHSWIDGLGPNAHLLAAERASRQNIHRFPLVGPLSSAPGGRARLALAVSEGILKRNQIAQGYLSAVRKASASIFLVHAYFLPDRKLTAELRRAARRGVRVRILLPALLVADVKAVALASLVGLRRLLQAGVEVRFVTQQMLHAKIGIIDGVWWTLGSANLDPLSHSRNLEANVVGYGKKPALELTRAVQVWYEGGRPWTLADDQARPWWLRLAGALAWRFRAFL